MPVHGNWRFEGGGKWRTFEVVIKLLQCIFGNNNSNDSWIQKKNRADTFFQMPCNPTIGYVNYF